MTKSVKQLLQLLQQQMRCSQKRVMSYFHLWVMSSLEARLVPPPEMEEGEEQKWLVFLHQIYLNRLDSLAQSLTVATKLLFEAALEACYSMPEEDYQGPCNHCELRVVVVAMGEVGCVPLADLASCSWVS